MFGTTEYISAAVGVALLGTVGFYKLKISNLENDISVMEKAAVVKQFEYSDCKKSIKLQNETIAKMNDIVIVKTDKLNNWKAKPPEIRYNTVYKKMYIYVDRNNTTGECNETKSIIDGIRTIDFNSI